MKGYTYCGRQRYEGLDTVARHNIVHSRFVDMMFVRNDETRKEHGPVLYEVYGSPTEHTHREGLRYVTSCSLVRLSKIIERDRERKLPKEIRIIRERDLPRRVGIFFRDE